MRWVGGVGSAVRDKVLKNTLCHVVWYIMEETVAELFV